LIFVLALAIASDQDALVARARAYTSSFKRWGGRILIAVGGWLIVLAVFADFFAGLFPV